MTLVFWSLPFNSSGTCHLLPEAFSLSRSAIADRCLNKKDEGFRS